MRCSSNIVDIVRTLVHATTTDIAEIDLRLDGLRVTVRRVPRTPGSTGEHDPAPSNLVHVGAPVVGTFQATVIEGERVSKGQPVGRIDALGLSIDIPAPVSGHVHRILADGEPVEYGQTLCTINPHQVPGR